MRIIKEILGFIFTFALIFSVFYVVMNYSSFKSIISYYLVGDEKARELEVVVGSKQEYHYNKIHLPPKGAKKIVKKEYPNLYFSLTPLDYRLIVPKIGKNVPLIKMSEEFISDDLWGQFEKEVQEVLKNGVVHYPGTANPGQKGNSFYTGHSSYYPWDNGQYKDVFVNLNQLDVGDEYFIYFQQNKYQYRVIEKKEVYPNEVKVLEQPENKKLSTLMTCWPVGTTLKRLIVIAEQV